MVRFVIAFICFSGLVLPAAGSSPQTGIAAVLPSQAAPPVVTKPAPNPMTEVSRWKVNWLEKPIYTFIELVTGNRVATITGGTCPTYSTCSGGKSRLLGSDGSTLNLPSYDRIRTLYNNGFVMQENKKFGFSSWDGKVLIPPRYEGLLLQGGLFFEARVAEGSLQVLGMDGKVILADLDDASLELEKLILGNRRDRWGVYDLSGKLLLPHRFQEFMSLGENVLGARVGSRWTLIDAGGRQLTPLRYQAFNDPVNGLMVFNVGGICESGYGSCRGGRSGVMREDGKVIMEAKYDCIEISEVGEEDDVEIRVITTDRELDPSDETTQNCSGGQVKVLKKDGTPWFKESFAFLDYLGNARFLRAVKEGSCDLEGTCERGKWGVIDREGRVVLEYKYDWIDQLAERGAVFVLNGKWGVFDADMKVLVPAGYEMLHLDREALRFLEKGKWGVMDLAGKAVVPAKYEAILPFINGVARFMEKGKWGLISTSGKILVPATHLAICSPNRKTHLFATEGKCTVKLGKDNYDRTITIAGQTVRRTGSSNPDCECEGGTFGLMDEAGKVLVPPKYQAILVQTMAFLSEHREGRTVVSSGIASLPHGQAWVRLNRGGKCSRIGTCTGGKWGLGDLKGRVIVPVEYPYVEPQANFLLRVAKGGECEVNSWRPQKCSPDTKWGLVRLEPVK